MEIPKGEAQRPLTQAEKAAKSIERMKTEAIHAQAMQLEYMRLRLIDLEDQVKQLTKDKRSLELKLMSSQRIINAQGERRGS
jgi:hypothetical protein